MNMPVLAPKHTGLKVSYTGLLSNARAALQSAKEPGYAEMLRQLQGHIAELGERYYSGDVAVVDEFLQLYCVAPGKRVELEHKQVAQPEGERLSADGAG